MSDYTGRHRPPTRAERRALERHRRLPKSLTPAHALPTAAAVALALTAAGATAAQSSPFIEGATSGAAAAITGPCETKDSGTAALLADPALADTAREEARDTVREDSGLTERRQQASATVAEGQGRHQERQRAARSEARQELAADKAEKKAEKAEDEKKAEQRSAGGSGTAAADTDDSSAETSESGWVAPLDDAVFTSPYGHRWGRLHAGQDYAAAIGTPLKAMGAGTVIGAGPMSGYGTYIDIEFEDGTVSRYGHLSSVSASVGQTVAAGDVVALSGNTGRSTGPHLHLEIRPGGGEPIDPAPWLAERGIG